MGQAAQNAEAIVESYDNDALGSESSPVEYGKAIGRNRVATTVNVDIDRKLAVGVGGINTECGGVRRLGYIIKGYIARNVAVQIEASLIVVLDTGLRAGRAKAGGATNTRPELGVRSVPG